MPSGRDPPHSQAPHPSKSPQHELALCSRPLKRPGPAAQMTQDHAGLDTAGSGGRGGGGAPGVERGPSVAGGVGGGCAHALAPWTCSPLSGHRPCGRGSSSTSPSGRSCGQARAQPPDPPLQVYLVPPEAHHCSRACVLTPVSGAGGGVSALSLARDDRRAGLLHLPSAPPQHPGYS